MKSAINELGAARAWEFALKHAQLLAFPDIECLGVVFNACILNPEVCPEMQNKKKTLSNIERIYKWVETFAKGYDSRISVRTSKMPGTIPDQAIFSIIMSRLPKLTEVDCSKIVYAHRLAMSAENIQGLLLEEYLSIKMRAFGWFSAWGATINAADMCNKQGDLIQIKNQSNTENSSSNKVRTGTRIHKWYRRDASTSETKWAELCALIKAPADYMSEEDYQAFIKETLHANPNALPLEPRNPWL